ncbi:MAG: GntR family transcriptional regulator [Prevotella sp.]|nr:GntR family transcriptional regulator [Prevotella sp.]
MIYYSDKALFVKIAERLCDDILADRYREGDRVPSVRELSAEYEVNANTALRAFEVLQRDDILVQQRGIGMQVARGAKRKVLNARRKDFVARELPDFLRRLDLLGLTADDVAQAWRDYQAKKA